MPDNTHNMSLGALLLMAVLFLSYAVGPSAESAPEKAIARADLQKHFSQPVVRLPISQKRSTPATASTVEQKTPARPNIQTESVLVWDREKQEALYAENASTTRPIASITKLLTASVVLQETTLEDIVTVSTEAVSAEGDAGQLRSGERLAVGDLLHIMLMESSNDAAFALAEYIGERYASSTKEQVGSFVSHMNATAETFGMQNSHFTGPAGLDDTAAYSTAHDIVRLIDSLRSDALFAPLWKILQKPQATVQSQNGGITHILQNNNPFVQELSTVIGGKTGYTEGARESLALVTKRPNKQGEIIFILLGSNDRFGDMRQLINWVANSFTW